MSINDIDKLSATKIDSLKRKQNHELARLQEGHSLHKAEIKHAHKNEIVDLQHQNLTELASESDKKEKVLSQMKHHLDMTKKMTDKEIQELKLKTRDDKNNLNETLSADKDKKRAEHDLFLEDLNHRFTNTHNELVGENREKLTKLSNEKGEELSSKEAHFNNRLETQTDQFSTRFRKDEQNYKQLKNDQDTQFKKERLGTNLRQQIEMDKLTTTHNKTLEVKDDNFRKGLKDQNLFFEKKYSENLKTRNDELNRLEDLNKKVESKIKGELQEKIETKINRSDDPFYRFTELKPNLQQFEDRVEITVSIPEHSKSDVQLTINNKEAVISYSRRYDDARKEGNATNKLHKVESFTTRLTTENFLDAKSVKSSYADGIMKYVIKRA